MNRKWIDNYNLLVEYREETKKLYPKHHEIYKGVNIGDWYHQQRTIYFLGKRDSNGSIRYSQLHLTKEKVKLLEEFGLLDQCVEFNHREKFDKMFALFQEYLKEKEDYPKSGVIYKGEKLGDWVTMNRRIITRGELIKEDNTFNYRGSILYLDEIEKLLDIDFVLTSNNWTLYYSLFQEYLKENGKNISGKDKYKGYCLGYFVSNISKTLNRGEELPNGFIYYNGNYLSRVQLEMIFSLDYKFKGLYTRMIDPFNIFCYLAKKYEEKNPGKKIRHNEIIEGYNVGAWLTNKIVAIRNGEEREDGSIKFENDILFPSQIEQLNELNIDYVYYRNYFNKTIMNDTNDYNKKKRIALLYAKKILSKEKDEINSKKDIELINKKLLMKLSGEENED